MENKKLYTKYGGIEEYRLKMAQHAHRNGISSAAREYQADRKTIRFWLKKYLAAKPHAMSYEDELGIMKNQSRLGQYHPNKLPDDIEKKIIEIRKPKNTNRERKNKIGARQIREILGLEYSVKTIHKKLKQAGLVTKPVRKYQKKRDMTEARNRHQPMEKLQTDVKYLTDIPNLYKDVVFNNIPKYQITVRDYKLGYTFIGFTYEKTSTSVAIFVSYVLHCLASAGFDLSKTYLQSDNGSEYRNTTKKRGLTFYEQVLVNNGVAYQFIPVGRPTYNSDVESFHGRIEAELYDYDDFGDLDTFMQKAWMYMIYYNGFRKNRNKNNMSPLQILKEYGYANLNKLVTFPPIIVDDCIENIEEIKSGEFKWSPLIIV
jgi:transposase InsO family protein